MMFENKYNKTYKFFELFCKVAFLVVINFDFLIFCIEPQLYIDFFSIFPLLFNILFTILMLYNIALTAKPKVIIKGDYLYVYSINKLNVKRKYIINNISSVVVNNNNRNSKYDSKALVISVHIDNKIINFALEEHDYERFRYNCQSGDGL